MALPQSRESAALPDSEHEPATQGAQATPEASCDAVTAVADAQVRLLRRLAWLTAQALRHEAEQEKPLANLETPTRR
jgi:hypothetical protein